MGSKFYAVFVSRCVRYRVHWFVGSAAILTAFYVLLKPWLAYFAG